MSTQTLFSQAAGRQPTVHDQGTTNPAKVNAQAGDRDALEQDGPVPGDEDDDEPTEIRDDDPTGQSTAADDVANRSAQEIKEVAKDTPSPVVKDQSDG